MLTVPAPAKLNLTLEVLGKRDDGYHEIRSVIQTISLCDELVFQPAQEIQIESMAPGWIPEESLVSKAVRVLQLYSDCSEGARIAVEKNIPLLSGLGGDSSDAAATLVGLNRMWRLRLSRYELIALAMPLGSDVPFFLYRGTALLEGRGEWVIALPPIPPLWVVLLVPPVPRNPGKTAQLYASLKPEYYTDGRITEKLVKVLREGKSPDPSLIFNTFENVAFDNPEIKPYREKMIEAGASNVHLAGSGPTLFTLLDNHREAEELHARLKEKAECYLSQNWP